MRNSRHQLPPLNPLPAFEASARLLSFTLAAEDLGVSQAAISQSISSLEKNLGQTLFERSPRKISLTGSGQRFQHAVTVALDLIETSAVSLRGQTPSEELVLAADVSMAHLWLLPRFGFFQKEFPNIEVLILATDREEECLREGVDLALLYGNGNWKGYDAHLLIKEEVFPICSPEYIKHRPPINKPEDLLNETLLDLQGVRWDWVGWQALLAGNGVTLGGTTQTYGFNSLPLLTQAALSGQGVGLGWESMVDDQLKDGSLVKPVNISLKTGRGYYALKKSNLRMSPEAEILFDWVIRANHSNVGPVLVKEL
ncbi:MAG: LysR family glycine cleavage system transcriptional activator [Saprospiraceae bacterium]|jgi:LysR family glycine cleavage system transcriptional activator